jgi:hypothetical protein
VVVAAAVVVVVAVVAAAAAVALLVTKTKTTARTAQAIAVVGLSMPLAPRLLRTPPCTVHFWHEV